jgi:hypothetical protein
MVYMIFGAIEVESSQIGSTQLSCRAAARSAPGEGAHEAHQSFSRVALRHAAAARRLRPSDETPFA